MALNNQLVVGLTPTTGSIVLINNDNNLILMIYCSAEWVIADCNICNI